MGTNEGHKYTHRLRYSSYYRANEYGKTIQTELIGNNDYGL